MRLLEDRRKTYAEALAAVHAYQELPLKSPPDAGRIQWHRTLAGKPAKEAMAMDQKGLVRAVAQRTRLSREESADITWAVLQGLAGQLSEGEARRLAADLPDPLAEQLQAPRRRRKGAHPAGVDDFIRQVSERTGLNDEDARTGTGAVLAALREALSEEDYGHLIGQLPAGYKALAEAVG
jgi:uncharacterized protein (DUF2267 family)